MQVCSRIAARQSRFKFANTALAPKFLFPYSALYFTAPPAHKGPQNINMPQLANQIAVVTGAGRGIGRAIALKFAAEGADVVCVSRTAENSDKVAQEVRAAGRKAWGVAVDVADAEAVAAAAEKILIDTGRVDILVNNAGVTRD